jgi:hypothetical protein
VTGPFRSKTRRADRQERTSTSVAKKTAKSPDATGTAHKAIAIDGLDGRVVSESERLQGFDQAPIRATLIGSDYCEVDGIFARGRAPVLGLCRALLAAGYDPRRPLHAHRGDTVALKIRSIGEGAAFTVEDNRRGTPSFRRWRNPSERSGAASPSACDSNRPLFHPSPPKKPTGEPAP